MDKKLTPGRPKLMEGGRQVYAYLSADAVKKAKILGAGNISAGIRRALAIAYTLGGDSVVK